MEPRGDDRPGLDGRVLLGYVLLAVCVMAGSVAGFVWAAESRLWAGFLGIAVTSGFASYLVGSE